MADIDSGKVRVEVIYALHDEQLLVSIDVEDGTTVREAVERSGLLQRYPQIELMPGRIGIFGRGVDLDARLHDGDRVEIYRALQADPKDARLRRARRSR